MKAEKRIVLYALLAGLLVWFADAGLDRLVYYREQGTFWQLLVTNVPAHEIYIRTLILGIFLVFGLMARNYIRQIRDANRLLQQSEQNLHTTLDSIGDGVIATDIQGRVVFMNPVAEALCGWRLDEARGQSLTSVFRIINEYTREPMESPVDKVLASGHIVGLANHTVLVSKNGPEYIIADSGSPIRSEAGEITGVVLVFRDDTARRRAEDEIRHFQARYESLYQASREAHAMVDLNGAILETNQAFRDLTGYSEQELDTLDFRAITPEKWHAMEQDILDTQVMARGYSDIYEKEYVRKDGRVVPIEIQAYLYRDRGGHAAGMWAYVRDISERKHSEDAQQQFRNIVYNSPLGVHMWDLDPDGALIFTGANPASDRMLGISCEDRIGKPVQEAFPGLEGTDVPDHYRRVAATGEPWFFEQVDYDDQQIRGAFEVYAFQTKPGSMAAMFLEITDRKRTEKALADNEARYRNMFENTGSGVVVYRAVDDGADFVIAEFNSAAERIESVPRENLIGRSVLEAFPGVREFGIFDVFQRVWRTGEAESFPLGFYADNRIQGWRDNYIYKLPSGEVVAVYDDVTARKKAEEALQIERDLLARITDTSPVGITQVDASGRIIFANRRAESILGLSKSHITQRTYDDPQWRIQAVDGGVLPADQLPFARVMATKEPVFDVQHALVLPDGNIRILSISASPLFSDSGAITGMVAAIEDITRRKQDEDALARYRNHLEVLVEERTEELRNAQQELIKAERLAALGQFSGNVSHEIRNPLGVIAASAFYLKRRLQGTDPKVDKHLEQINTQVDNCSRIIQSILDLTRMEAPRKQRVNLCECIRAGLTSAGPPPRGVALDLDLPPEALEMDADAEQLRMAFKNLVMNAFQAMGKSGGVLSVSAQITGAGPEAAARIRIADTGPGIPAAIRDKIFQPLFTTRAQGIGFGLSITQMIIERHDGTIALAPDPGAAFVITLPISGKEVPGNA